MLGAEIMRLTHGLWRSSFFTGGVRSGQRSSLRPAAARPSRSRPSLEVPDGRHNSLRQFASWCRTRSLPLFSVRRAGIETFARELEARGRARATVTRRLCTIAGFYRYAVEEELPGHSPAAHVRRPRLDYESHATALDRSELGASWSPPGSARPPGTR